MTRFLAILAALTCAASAQTYRTVTADTNNVIRTNFTLGAAQVSGAFAISNVTGLQSALDEKLATNGSAAGLTNFPALLLTTNSAASAFPAALLRTNGDGGGLTNLPNANLSNAVGILPLSNGGTGATNASTARTALQLGSAATNDASAFQPANTNLTALAAGDGSNLTNVTVTDASSLTNFPSELLRTNGSAAGLTNFPSSLLRTNGDGSGLTNVSVDLTTVLPAYSNNAAKVLAVASGETNVEWIAVSNTVTDASTLTNFPASILQTNSADGSFPAFLLRTNGSAAGLTSFPSSLLTTNGSASGLTNFPTLNQNTTGTASNVTGVVAISNGGSGQTTAAAAIEAFLPAYSGNANRILALNSNANGLVWTTNASGGGIVNLADTTNGVTNTLGIVNGGTGGTNRDTFFTAMGLLDAFGTTIELQSGRTNSDEYNSVIIGVGTTVKGSLDDAVVIGRLAKGQGDETVAIGYGADAKNNRSTAIGFNAYSESANIVGPPASVAIGWNSYTAGRGAIAIGHQPRAVGTNAVQFGDGSNSVANSIQFLSSGSVDTTEWGYLANASTKGGSRMTNTNGVTATNTIIGYNGTNYTTNTITVIDGIITSWTQ